MDLVYICLLFAALKRPPWLIGYKKISLRCPMAYSLPWLVATLGFVAVPSLDPEYWWIFFISLPVKALGFGLHMRAIQISPLSLTLPYLAFTPVFMFVSGPLLLGEVPNLWGF